MLRPLVQLPPNRYLDLFKSPPELNSLTTRVNSELVYFRPCYVHLNYRKIPEISPGAYIFQRPFLRGLFLEGPIFGGAYVRREICVIKLVGPACSGKEIYH